MSVEQMHGNFWAECKRHRPEWQGPIRSNYGEARDDETEHNKGHRSWS
jgi:hypothetical protein